MTPPKPIHLNSIEIGALRALLESESKRAGRRRIYFWTPAQQIKEATDRQRFWETMRDKIH